MIYKTVLFSFLLICCSYAFAAPFVCKPQGMGDDYLLTFNGNALMMKNVTEGERCFANLTGYNNDKSVAIYSTTRCSRHGTIFVSTRILKGQSGPLHTNYDDGADPTHYWTDDFICSPEQ